MVALKGRCRYSCCVFAYLDVTWAGKAEGASVEGDGRGDGGGCTRPLSLISTP